MGFRGRLTNWTHFQYVTAWPLLRAAGATDRASTIRPTYRWSSLAAPSKQHVFVRSATNSAVVSHTLCACKELTDVFSATWRASGVRYVQGHDIQTAAERREQGARLRAVRPDRHVRDD
jgi:hypothetical protein